MSPCWHLRARRIDNNRVVGSQLCPTSVLGEGPDIPPPNLLLTFALEGPGARLLGRLVCLSLFLADEHIAGIC